jgi:hypothetical protein
VIAGFSATHAVHYTNGYFVEITNTLTYTGSLSSLGWQVTLPTGWSFVSNAGTLGAVQPSIGSTDTIGWGYITVPASPITFTYVVDVPFGATGSQVLAGQIFFSIGAGGQQSILATPSPLTVNARTGSIPTPRAPRRLPSRSPTIIRLTRTRSETSTCRSSPA